MKLLAILLLCSLGLSSLCRAELSTCTPSFPKLSNPYGTWLGGDVAHSVPISPNKTLWLFGDTFIAPRNIYDRAQAKMVSNSAAIGVCTNGNYQLHYQWKMNPDLTPKEIFSSPIAGVKLWPEKPHLYRGVLFTPLTQSVTPPGGGALDFTVVGATLARVRNFSEASAQWSIEYLPLYTGAMSVGHGSAVRGGYLYLIIANKQNSYLARVNLVPLMNSSVTNAAPYLESISLQTGLWRRGIVESDLLPLGFAASGGSTLFYNQRISKWQIVYHDSSVFGGNRIESRVTASVLQPWSNAKTVHLILESTPSSSEYRTDIFCYTGFNHPEFTNATMDELVITYVCNSLDFELVQSDQRVYWPRRVRVDNPF